MLVALKHLFRAITAMQHNAPALLTLVALMAMGVVSFALYVVLTVVRP